MSISPTIYSNASVRTFQRVMNALHNEGDPYKAAKQFEKDPTVSFCNEGAKVFGYDYYERQNLDKDKFTAAVVDAWRKLQRSDQPEAKQVFQIQDAWGNPCTCVLSKAENGEIEWGQVLDNSDTVTVIETIDAPRVQVMTSVIATAVKLVKDLFTRQEVSFSEAQPIELADNKIFQLNVAQEVLADADTNDFPLFVGALKYIIVNDALIEAGALKNIIENKDKYGKEVIQSCISSAIKDADKYGKEIIQQCVSTIIENRKFFDESFVKSTLKDIVINTRYYEPVIVQDCALFIATHNLWSKETARVAANIIADVIIYPHEHEVARVQKCVLSIVNHTKCWNHLVVQQAVRTVVSIVANKSNYESGLVQDCARAIVNNPRFYDAKIIKLAARIIGDIVTHAHQYTPEVVQNCASSIVNHPKFWDKKIVMEAFETLAKPTFFESLPSQTMAGMARIVISSNADFFNAPIQNQAQFASFYQAKDRVEDIQCYTDGLLNAGAKHQKVSIVWTDPTPESPSVRYFIKGDIKIDKSLTLKDAFYNEKKEKIAGSPNKSDDSPAKLVLTMPSLLIQGDLEAAIRLDRGVARYIVEHRSDKVITAWNEHLYCT